MTENSFLLSLAVGADHRPGVGRAPDRGGLALQYIETRLVAAAGESLTVAAVAITDKLDLLMAEVSGDSQRMADSQTV